MFNKMALLTAMPGRLVLEGEVLSSDGKLKQKFECVAEIPGKLGVGFFGRIMAYLWGAAITHVTAIRNALADLVVDAIDVGSGTATGLILIEISGGATTLATIVTNLPAFGAAAAGVASGTGLNWEDTSADAGGTAAEFDFIDRDAAIVFEGNVQTSGGDINLSSLTISATDIVRITSASYTAPA